MCMSDAAFVWLVGGVSLTAWDDIFRLIWMRQDERHFPDGFLWHYGTRLYIRSRLRKGVVHDVVG